ncbi:MAG: DNA mismatch repair protein MutS, partial [Acidobacteria bacterium]|nr:DNA mismatch repair protein MutS [Acidobacteriota bacterium]
MTSATPQEEYVRRLARWDAEISAFDRTNLRISNLRLLTAGIAILTAAPVMRGTAPSWWLLGPAIVFVGLVVAHARMLAATDRARRARAWYERGVARMEGRWSGSGATGARFLAGQPFAADLDVFGQGSVFQLLNTARTEAGEDTLAGWLLAGAPPAEIRDRQAAVAELRPNVDFRERLAATTVGAHTGRTGRLTTWATKPSAGLAPIWAVVFAMVGLTSATLLVASYRELIDGRALAISILIQTALAAAFWRKSAAAFEGLDEAGQDLAVLTELLERIEGEQFRSPRLQRLRDSLQTQGAMPSRRIVGLMRLINWNDSTRNQIFAPIALLLMVPFVLAVLIDRWHARYARAINGWLQAIGDIEAFAALATYAYEHPAAPFPTVVEDGPVFVATSLEHPLIASGVAVANDVSIGGTHPHLLLVSGSNMSGKSTLLRAIGVNVVLAQAGAPVRAASLTLSPLEIGSSLRIEDSLQAGHSRFYAEILRIRAIVDLTRQPKPLLFLLDEVLAGTNSHDRRIGAQAVVRTLVEHGAIGLVTTHDLALADVVST